MFQFQTFHAEKGPSIAHEKAIFELIQTVWPPADGETPPTLDASLLEWRVDKSVHFIIENQGKVVAHSRLFRREISTGQGPITVGALAQVCVHPASRGQGFGEAVVLGAFDFLPQLGADVALFQTGVPRFYEKLGARIVTNRFFNGADTKNPFWDECEMIFPASYSWPEGSIDLRGPGY